MKNIFFVVLFLIIGCNGKKKYHDKKEVVKSSYTAVNAIVEFQDELNKSFKDPETSPLPDRYRKNFEGLDFFKPDTTYIVKATLERTPEALPFLMPTNTDRTTEEVVYGVLHFMLKNKPYQLQVYKGTDAEEDKNYLFLPFMDATNGVETYGGGRYMDLTVPEGDTIVVDFNKAYNPYCAYNKKYSCPKVPKINVLHTAINAGVKVFKIEK